MASPSPTNAGDRDCLAALLRAGGIGQHCATADALIREFGTLRRTITAPARRVAAVVASDTQVLLALYRQALMLVLRPEPGRTSLRDWRELNAYLGLAMGTDTIERFRILHLDSRNRLIVDDDWSHGTIDEAPAYVREIVHRALDVGSAALLLVHNHPSGDTEPSRADIALTRSLDTICASIGIAIHDHIIVTAAGLTSMRAKRHI